MFCRRCHQIFSAGDPLILHCANQQESAPEFARLHRWLGRHPQKPFQPWAAPLGYIRFSIDAILTCFPHGGWWFQGRLQQEGEPRQARRDFAKVCASLRAHICRLERALIAEIESALAGNHTGPPHRFSEFELAYPRPHESPKAARN